MKLRAASWAARTGVQGFTTSVRFAQRFVGSVAYAEVRHLGKTVAYAQYQLGTKRVHALTKGGERKQFGEFVRLP